MLWGATSPGPGRHVSARVDVVGCRRLYRATVSTCMSWTTDGPSIGPWIWSFDCRSRVALPPSNGDEQCGCSRRQIYLRTFFPISDSQPFTAGPPTQHSWSGTGPDTWAEGESGAALGNDYRYFLMFDFSTDSGAAISYFPLFPAAASSAATVTGYADH